MRVRIQVQAHTMTHDAVPPLLLGCDDGIGVEGLDKAVVHSALLLPQAGGPRPSYTISGGRRSHSPACVPVQPARATEGAAATPAPAPAGKPGPPDLLLHLGAWPPAPPFH